MYINTAARLKVLSFQSFFSLFSPIKIASKQNNTLITNSTYCMMKITFKNKFCWLLSEMDCTNFADYHCICYMALICRIRKQLISTEQVCVLELSNTFILHLGLISNLHALACPSMKWSFMTSHSLCGCEFANSSLLHTQNVLWNFLKVTKLRHLKTLTKTEITITYENTFLENSKVYSDLYSGEIHHDFPIIYPQRLILTIPMNLSR